MAMRAASPNDHSLGSEAMILTDAGIDVLQVWRAGLGRVVSSACRFALPSPWIGIDPVVSPRGAGNGWSARAMMAIPESMPHRSGPQANPAALSPAEQRARVVALRGLSQARAGEQTAVATFQEALRLDPSLDLTKLPSFWKMPGTVHDAVIEALEREGRDREVATLIADLRTRFRPRLLPRREPASDTQRPQPPQD
jgi:hypothetical protein